MREVRQQTMGISSRRSACDRCRGQKLRCLREGRQGDTDGRCDRCVKADAQCVTSPIYHIRPYTFPAGKGSVASVTSTVGASRSMSGPKPNKRSRTQTQARCEQRTGHTQQTGQTSSAAGSIPGAFLSWQASDVPQAELGFTSESDSVSGSKTTSVSSQSPQGWNSLADSVAAPLPNIPAVHQTAHSWDADGLTLEHLFAADKTFTSFSGGTAAHTASPLGEQRPQPMGTASSHSGKWLLFCEDALGDCSPEDYGGMQLGLHVQQDASFENVPHQANLAEELSSINHDLVTQLSRMTQGPPYMTMKTLIMPQCECAGGQGSDVTETALSRPIDDIFNTTRRYLDVVTRIAGPSARFMPRRSFPVPASGASASNGSISTSSPSESSDLSSSSDDSSQSSADTIPPSTTTDTSSTRFDNPGLGPLGNHRKVDSATLLLILICYVHVLRLHVALFAHAYEYFLLLSQSGNSTIDPIPGLCGLGNFPVRKWPFHLQVSPSARPLTSY
ncbi:hypothetical protein N656DRAFT_779052 [Canariomyces notabilis]|uniref:Zn(2)-C6 fungal-type domain-containing protein n=1 Tax=Canariomyces notabilis TaxID=2074819 RepID=A0AAN6YSF8_9PEZI|nr:hypothetical protein N656DRAFT_779052 [Canariomyces arenarius]